MRDSYQYLKEYRKNNKEKVKLFPSNQSSYIKEKIKRYGELYKRYYSIMNRCNSKKNKDYKNYGGRGIKVEWNSFKEFNDDMYQSYLEHVKIHGKKQTSLDRIDVNGNYCKENCRWATYKIQATNRRGVKLLHSDVYKIREMHSTGNYYYTEIAKKFNVSSPTIRSIIIGKIWKHI